MAIKSSGQLSLNDDIRPEIDIDVNQTDVSLGDNNTEAFTAVADGSTTTGRSMSEMYGYSAVPAYYPETEAEGALGESLNFNGSNQYLDWTPALTGNRKTWTLSMWVKRNDASTSDNTLISQGSSSINNVFTLRLESNKLSLYTEKSGASNKAVGNTLLLDTTSWYHIVVAFDVTKQIRSERLRFYVNSIEEKDFTYSGTSGNFDEADWAFNRADSIRIGQYRFNSSGFFNGTIADFKFIDGEQLRPDSFGKLDNGIWIPKAFNTASTDTLVTNNLQLNYQFEGNADDSANSNDGTVSGATFRNNNYGIYDFDGSNDSISFTNPISTSSNTDASVNFWINFDTEITSSYIPIFERQNGSIYPGIMTYLYGTSTGLALSLERYYGTNQLYSNSYNSGVIFPYKKNKWYNFSATYTAATKKVIWYVDGNKVGELDLVIQNSSRTTGSGAKLGAVYNDSIAFNGQMGEVQLYSDVLTPAEVKQNYNAQKHKYAYGLNGFQLPLNNTSTGSIDSSSNLKLHLDGSDSSSYGGSGTTWSDLTTNNNDGTISGAGFLSSTNSGVFDFDGSNDKVTFSNSLNPSTKAFEVWLNPDTFSSDQWAFQQGNGQGIENYLRVYSGGVQIRMGNQTLTHSYTTTGKWIHVVGTQKASSGFEFYFNGKLVQETTSSLQTLTTNGTDKFYLGARYNSGDTGFFNGKIAQVRVYDKVLTADQIIKNYRATQGNYEQVSTVDISGNANSFNSTQLTYTDHSASEPANTYVALNPAAKPPTGTYEYQYGNTRTYSGTHNVDFGTTGTMSVTSGKWYFECKFIANANYSGATGWMDAADPTLVHNDIYIIGAISTAGTQHIRVNTTTGTNTWVTVKSNFSTSGTWTEKVSVAFDADTGKLWVKAASDTAWYNSGDPAAGTNPVTTVVSESGNTVQSFIMFAAQGGRNRGVWWYPEEGDWEGTVPTGFKAVSTANLATPVINPADNPGEKPQDYFKPVLYQGTGAQQGQDYGYKSGSRAAVFNGSSGKIVVNGLLTGITNTMSVSCWAKINSDNKYCIISNTGDIPTTNSIALIIHHTNNNYYIQFGSSADQLSGSTSGWAGDGKWHHFAITKTSSSLKFYVDGVLHDSDTSHTNSISGRTNANIGAYFPTGYNNYSKGEMDDLRIYTDELSAAEVGYIYNDTTASIPTDNLKAHYKFENNANDTSLTNGKIDGAAIFNGSNSKITINYSNLKRTIYSVSFWINADDYTQSGTSVVNMGLDNTGGSWGGLAFGINNDKVFYYGGDVSGVGGTGFFTQTGTQNITDGNWVHVVMLVNGTSVTGYVNNVQDTGLTRTLGSNIVYKGGSQNTIGVRSGGFGSYGWWNGKVDDLRIYSDILTSTEIGYLYNNTTASIPTDNLIAYYKLDVNSRDTIGDHHGTDSNIAYGYDGTESNITYTFDEPVDNIKVGWKPDLVWTKDRDSNDNHVLVDSVRGATKAVFSNLTQTELTSAGYTNRFDDDGFTQGNDSSTNRLGKNNVAWVWKAGGNPTSAKPFMIDNTGYATASAASLDDGGITPSSASINTDSGFSILTWTGAAGAASNLDVSLAQSSSNYAVANTGKSSGKLYWEFTCGSYTTAATFMLGIVNSSNKTASWSNANNHFYYGSNGAYYKGSQQATTGATYTTGDVIGFALNFTDDEMSWYKNGTLQFTEDITNGATYFPAIGTGLYPVAGTFNFGGSSFAHTIPTGFSAYGSSVILDTSTHSGATFTGDNSISHGLDKAPELIMVKDTGTAYNWYVFTDVTGTNYRFEGLNTNSAASEQTQYTVDATKIKDMTTIASLNTSGKKMLVYAWHSVEGFSKIGYYSGNGNASGPFVNVGFEPAFLLIKRRDGATNWRILDNKRNPGNSIDKEIYPPLNNAESAYTAVNFHSNGFKVLTSDVNYNTNSGEYIYMAFAGDAQKHSNATGILGDGNEFIQDGYYPEDNFTATTYSGNSSTQTINTGFETDFVWLKKRSGADNHFLFDSIRGSNVISSDVTTAESAYGTNHEFFADDGFNLVSSGGTNNSSHTYVAWSWKAAGQPKRSARFNGSSSYISTTNPLGTGNKAYTISAWVYLNASSHTGGIYTIWDGGTTTGAHIFFKVESGSISIGNYGGSVTSSNTLSVKKWVHVAVTRDTSNNVVLYVNGLSDKTGTLSLNLANNNPKIGALNTTTQNLNGQLDQVRVFNKALSASEITTVYNETVSDNDTLQILGGGDTSCVAAYKLDGNALDLSGSYNGTESNITYPKNSHYAYNVYENGVRTTSHKASTQSLDAGTIIPDAVNANRDNGFSIVKYTGTGVAGNYAHGLSKTPEMIISKNISWSTPDWFVWHKDLTNTTNYLRLSTSAAEATAATVYSGSPSSSLVEIGNDSGINRNNGDQQIAYIFHSVPGFSKIGTYSGSNSSLSITTGFNPSFLLIKRTDTTGSWVIIDNKRGDGYGAKALFPDIDNVETHSWNTTFNDTGFTIDSNEAWVSTSGGKYIYMAFK